MGAKEKNAAETGSLPYLSQAGYIGQGFDITGAYALPESLILPVVDPAKASLRTFDFLGTRYSIPSYVTGIVDTSGQFVEDACSTREEVQDSFSVTAAVEVGYGAFSGEMEASYGREYAASSEYDFAYRNFYSRLGMLTIGLAEAQAALADDFVKRCEELPNEVSAKTMEDFEVFFHDYGMYVTSKIAIGGSLEYYSAVEKKSESSLTEIAANLKAEYSGTFVTGAFSSEITRSETWKRYAQNRHVNLSVRGGDPDLLAQLAGVDVNAPSSRTVTIYDNWAKSIASAPAVSDFSLIGIWQLIPDSAKRKRVAQAFSAMQSSMRPRLVVETAWKTGWPPTVTIGKVIRPEMPPEKPAGYQLLMIDRTDISSAGVHFDRYYTVADNTTYASYKAMYDEMAEDIEQRGYDSTKWVMVLASFGLSLNAPPTADLYPVLRSFGGGPALTRWIQISDPGRLKTAPGAYILVGIGSLGPDTGVELLSKSGAGATIAAEVFFYRQRGAKLYSLSAGKRSGYPVFDEESQRRSYLVEGTEQAYVEDVD